MAAQQSNAAVFVPSLVEMRHAAQQQRQYQDLHVASVRTAQLRLVRFAKEYVFRIHGPGFLRRLGVHQIKSLICMLDGILEELGYALYIIAFSPQRITFVNSMPAHRRTSQLNIWKIAAFVVTLTTVAFICVAPQVTNDFWLQAKVGELIVSNFEIPKTLLFPFTEIQTAKFNAHEWLPSILFYELIQLFGEAALPLVLGGFGFILFTLVSWLAYRRSQHCLPLALMLGLLAVGVENFRHFLRPELVSLILFVVYLHLLESCRQRPSRATLIGIVAVVVIWSNTHGSFILAPIVASIFSMGVWLDMRRSSSERMFVSKTNAKSFAALALVTLVCTAVNPTGWEQTAFVFNFTGSDFTKGYVLEWISSLDPIAWHWRGFWIGLGCTIVALSLSVLRWSKLSAIDAIFLLCFVLLAVKATRFVVYLGIATAYILPPLIPKSVQRPDLSMRLYALCAILSATVLGFAIKFGNAYGAYPHESSLNQSFTSPMRSVLSNPTMHGNVMTTYDYGAELVYRTYPRLRPSLDSRIDSYGEDYILFTERLLVENDLLVDFVQKYDVRYMLLTHEDFGLIRTLPSLMHWNILVMDKRAVLIERENLH